MFDFQGILDWIFPDRFIMTITTFGFVCLWWHFVCKEGSEGTIIRDDDGNPIRSEYPQYEGRRNNARVGAWVMFVFTLLYAWAGFFPEHVIKHREQLIHDVVNFRAPVNTWVIAPVDSGEVDLEAVAAFEEKQEVIFMANWRLFVVGLCIFALLRIVGGTMTPEDRKNTGKWIRAAILIAVIIVMIWPSTFSLTKAMLPDKDDSASTTEVVTAVDSTKVATEVITSDVTNRGWVDILFVLSLLIFVWQIFASSERSIILWKKSRYAGIITMLLCLMAYLTIRPYLVEKSGFTFSIFVNLIQFILVVILIKSVYSKFWEMFERKQCMTTIDPVEREYMPMSNGSKYFVSGMISYVTFMLLLVVVLSFPLDILKLSTPLWGRFFFMTLAISVVGVVWWGYCNKHIQNLLSKLQEKRSWIPTNLSNKIWVFTLLILGGLSFLLPGLGLFILLLLLMTLAWFVGTITEVQIANKLVIEIFSKDRYHPALFLFMNQVVKKIIEDDPLEPDEKIVPKSDLRDGIHIMAVPVWAPFTRFFLFLEEILEVDKYKIDDKLPTSLTPCRFTAELDDNEQPTGRLIEVLRPEFMKDKDDPDASEIMTGPPVELEMSQRFRKFEDTRAFLRRDLTDRRDPIGLIQRSTQNIVRRVTRKLSVEQAVSGGYYVSDKHLFWFAGQNKPMTVRQMIRKEGMEAVGFLETDTETSDANPPEGLEDAQLDVKKAEYKLQKVIIEAKAKIIEIGAEGEGLGVKIGHVEIALKTGVFSQAAFAGIQALKFAENAGTILFPAGFLDQVSRIAASIAGPGSTEIPTAPVLPATPVSQVSEAEDATETEITETTLTLGAQVSTTTETSEAQDVPETSDGDETTKSSVTLDLQVSRTTEVTEPKVDVDETAKVSDADIDGPSNEDNPQENN